MAIDTKPNFSCTKFEQCATDVMNLSGCTQIYGQFHVESGATLAILDNKAAGKLLTSDADGKGTWQLLGTPSSILSTSTNVSSGTTHIHAFDGQSFVSGTQGILVDGNNKFYLDNTYITDATLPNIYTYTGVTTNQSLGVLPSGQTLGMVYITNTGSSTAYLSLGTTPTGDDITPYQTIQVDPNEDVSVTVNMRLSLTANTTIYISSVDWTNVGLKVQWANITYQNASTTINPGDLPIASPTTLGAIKVGSGLDIDGSGILSVTGGTGGGTVTGATNLGTGNGTIYTSLSGKDLQFKTLSGGTNITLTCNANYISINSTGGGAGTITGGTNGLGVSGANITLGGTLTGTTNICTASNTFRIYGVDGTTDGLWINDFGTTYLGKSADGTTCGGYIQFDTLSSNLVAENGNANAYVCMCFEGNAGCGFLSFTTGFTITDVTTNPKGLTYHTSGYNGFVDASLITKKYVDDCIISGNTAGGFLGTVTKATSEPTGLRNNQWVKPEPMSTGCFNYTFDNFVDSGSTAISVNLSLEDVYLRYKQGGDYWIKESYNRPITSGRTWIGNANCEVCEVQVIDEWVGTEAALLYAGQKFTYPTQTISQTDVATCTISPNYVIRKNIPLNVSGITSIFTIPTGCVAIINSAKLIFLQNATPTTICVALGNNYCINPQLGYNNLVSCQQIDDLTLNCTYSLTPLEQGVTAASGADVYFLVGTATSCALCAHLLIEGFIY